MPGTDLGTFLLASDRAPYRVPGTDLGPFLLASDRASHPVPGTDLGSCLLASDRASHPVPGTDLGSLFASIRPGAAPGARHRFGLLFASIRPGAVPGAWHRLGQPVLYTWYQSLASISPPACFPLRPLRLCGETRDSGRLLGETLEIHTLELGWYNLQESELEIARLLDR